MKMTLLNKLYKLLFPRRYWRKYIKKRDDYLNELRREAFRD
jgi:hypothetical protein